MRGLAAQEAELEECEQEQKNAVPGSYNPYKVYELPFQHILNKYNFLSRIPMCPQYQEIQLPSLPRFRKKRAKTTE